MSTTTLYTCACGRSYAPYAGHGGMCPHCDKVEAEDRLSRRQEADRLFQEQRDQELVVARRIKAALISLGVEKPAKVPETKHKRHYGLLLLHVLPADVEPLQPVLDRQAALWGQFCRVLEGHRRLHIDGSWLWVKDAMLESLGVWRRTERFPWLTQITEVHGRWLAERFAKTTARKQRIPVEADCPQFVWFTQDVHFSRAEQELALPGLPRLTVLLHPDSKRRWPKCRIAGAIMYSVEKQRRRRGKVVKISTDWRVKLVLDHREKFVSRKDNGRPRTDKTQQIVELLAAGTPIKQIARVTGVARTTVKAVLARTL